MDYAVLGKRNRQRRRKSQIKNALFKLFVYNMGDHFCQLWKMLMQNCSEKNQELIISVVKTIVAGMPIPILDIGNLSRLPL